MNWSVNRYASALAGVFLAVLYLATCSAFAQPHENGFYAVETLNGKDVLGHLAYIHEQEYLNDGKRMNGLRAVFGKSGTIEYDFGVKSYWWNTTFQAGRVSFRPVGQAELIIELRDRVENVVQSARLRLVAQTEAQLSSYFRNFAPAKTIYVGHRGSPFIKGTNNPGIYPSNTIEAFESALKSGYQGFECDVQLTEDNELVVSHDKNLAVSTDCKGSISEKNAADITSCQVLKSGLLPESGFAADTARAAAHLPSLREVFETFLPDPRVRVVMVDVKPANPDRQVIALSKALAGFTPDQVAKIVYLVRDDEVTAKAKPGSRESIFALEGSSGWEPMDPNLRAQYLDSSKHDSVSLSLGLGLGLNGFGKKPAPTVRAVGNLLRGAVGMILSFNIDIGFIGWSKENFREYRSVLGSAKERGMSVVAWTINTPKKVTQLREQTPHLDYVLSDLPYSEIARIQILETAPKSAPQELGRGLIQSSM